MSLICPSTNTALGRNGLRGVNACGRSSLNAHSHEESIVMPLVIHEQWFLFVQLTLERVFFSSSSRACRLGIVLEEGRSSLAHGPCVQAVRLEEQFAVSCGGHGQDVLL